MDFANERYVRLYVRDTTTWLLLEFEGQTVLMHMLRKADRAGVIDLAGREPWQAPVVHCRIPAAFARVGMEACLREGVIVHDGDRLVFPRYIEANESAMSDKQRAKESRAKRSALVTKRDVESQNVTAQSQNVSPPSRAVTDGHSESHDVTPCRAVPCRTEERESARAETDLKAVEPDTGWIRLGKIYQQLHDAEQEGSRNPRPYDEQRITSTDAPRFRKLLELTKTEAARSGAGERQVFTSAARAFLRDEKQRAKGLVLEYFARDFTTYVDRSLEAAS